MKHTDIRSLYRSTAQYADQDVTVAGWIRTNRGSNKFGFIELNDGTFFKSVQIVYRADVLKLRRSIPLSIATALVTGRLVLTPDRQLR